MIIAADSRKCTQLHQQNRHNVRKRANQSIYSPNSHFGKVNNADLIDKKRQLIAFNEDEFKDEAYYDYSYENKLNEHKYWQEIKDYIEAQWRDICDTIDLNDTDLLECLLPPLNIFNGKEIYWINELTSQEYTPFINILSHAIHIGHTKCIRILLDKIYIGELSEDLIHESYYDEQVPLWNACELGDINLVRELIEYAHVDINAHGFLKLAVELNNDRLVDYLLSLGCDIDLYFNRYILHHAVHKGYHCIVKNLLKYGVDPNIQDYMNQTPLDYAISRRDIEMIEVLLKHTHINIHSNSNNFTPMMLAVYHDLRPIVDLIFQLLPFNQCIDDLIYLACRYTVDVQMENQEMAFYFFSQGLNRKQISDNLILYEVYEFRRECQTLEELESIQDNNHAMRLNALLANERIFLQYGYAKLYTTIIQQQCDHYRNNNLIHRSFQLLLHACQMIFQVQNDNYDLARLNCGLYYQLCEDFFDIWEQNGSVSIDSLVIMSDWMFNLKILPTDNQVELLLIIICMIQSKKLTRNVQYVLVNIIKRIETKDKSYILKQFIQSITYNIFIAQSSQFSFTILSIIRLLIQCGADVNAICGTWTEDRPLHLIAKCSNILEAKAVIELFLAYGAHPDATNNLGQQPKDGARVHKIKQLLSTSRHLSLKCRCAQLIVSQNINCERYFNTKLIDFIQLHRKTNRHSRWNA